MHFKSFKYMTVLGLILLLPAMAACSAKESPVTSETTVTAEANESVESSANAPLMGR